MDKITARNKMNEMGAAQVPFFFMLDFELKKCEVYSLIGLPETIQFEIDHQRPSKFDLQKRVSTKDKINLNYNPMSLEDYNKGFSLVKEEIQYGNSFLLNLTNKTELVNTIDLEEIYKNSSARYKLLVEDEFVVFSPEIFVQIKDGYIRSFPMKGTIDASIENAEEIISKDQKEIAEHYTIVDLIRNDLSIVAKNVKVDRFRYAERIQSANKDLFQISSEISGELPKDYHHQIGEIIFKLLPAGSISGAPKKKTCDIIQQAEQEDRGYYTGVFGVFDGQDLDAGVMIRFIEKTENGFYYRSGGGITFQSELEKEYQEMLDKIYVPLH